MSTKQIVQYRTMTMRPFSHALLLALLFSSISLATATAAPTGAQAVDEAWRKAITANDVNAIVTLYSRDAVMWLPDAPEAKGREAIRKSYMDKRQAIMTPEQREKAKAMREKMGKRMGEGKGGEGHPERHGPPPAETK